MDTTDPTPTEQPATPPPAPPYAPPHPSPYPPAARQRRPWRAALAGGVVGALAAAAVAVPVTWQAVGASTTSSTSAQAGAPVQPSYGDSGGGWSFPGQGGGSFTPGTVPGAATEATGTAATDAQQQGVLLIDTTLTNGSAAGTGMVLDSSGTALTNYHVVEGSTSVRATVASTGETYEADVIGVDEKADVALIQLRDASGLDTVTIDDDTTAIGDAVTAVGNALGQDRLLAATGRITAEEQAITTQAGPSDRGEDLTGLLETDAGVVSGYSGGPMYDAEGEVVGISTAASSGRAQSYAVPIGDALTIVDQIEAGNESGDVRIGPAAYLAIEAASTETGSGIGVAGVEQDGPAATAGLAAGDTVTALGGTRVSSLDELRSALDTHEPGDQVSLTWVTASGQTEKATVTLGSSPVA